MNTEIQDRFASCNLNEIENCIRHRLKEVIEYNEMRTLSEYKMLQEKYPAFRWHNVFNYLSIKNEIKILFKFRRMMKKCNAKHCRDIYEYI